ncbi:NAD-dependent succinate-semialdehyde dehydrogenase [Isachenkonia alkalipeptolytica]|uniref:NAD-dependent succinate-semialdehyde dehydrogenase n=1 Tax=Isachenkonia alkalipeptolytica TaxID=2565777 RepID=A0AA43XIL0_9CLOT|nr:NAD-dependent succinate-semialdehyde dehydrogenase [Isachenkonia alkalipeptolytica]NBG87004.1 NAD-dependent succinate-semialdehyde dehydrogenase [Isachenkonia alkalipeptolytica]
MKHLKNYINGNWTEGDAGSFSVNNPATGEVLAMVPKASPEQVRGAVDDAETAFRFWSKETAETRSNHLRRLYDLILENVEELGRTITLEQGKPLKEGIGEVRYGASFVQWYSEEAKRVTGEMIPASHKNKRIMVLKQPVGVVAAITPWNFPFAMITRKIAPALAAGCTVIIKPASQTPISAIKIMELVEKAGFPKGVVNLVTGDAASIGNVFLDHKKIKKITFTGSTEVGKELYRGAADTVKRISLELGGHAPFILFDDGKLFDSIQGALASKFRNCGQACISSNRFYVQQGIQAEFIEGLKIQLKSFRQGNGLTSDTDLGPLIDQRAYEKVSDHVTDALSKGAALEYRGDIPAKKPNGEGGYFYPPTILSGIGPDMKIYREETFGPVIPIIPFREEEELLTMANDSDYGLAAYVYTQDLSRALRVSEALEYGIIGLNDGAPSTAQAPFGGFKESGIDREGGHYGIEPFLETKYISIGL